MKTINADVIILGGGIAGLWLHHRLNDMGLYALLVDNASLGGGQTLSSQGIIHGGAKYTLHGMLSNAASAIAHMPARWQQCLDGHGDINLSNTKVLSQHQLMWSTQSVSSKVTSFFSSKALNGKMQPIDKTQYPEFFTHKTFKGHLYQLNEPVLDVPSLMQNLSAQWRHRTLRACPSEKDNRQSCYTFNYTRDEKTRSPAIQSVIIESHLGPVKVTTKELVLSSGEGNEALLQQLDIQQYAMQRRPLKMVLAKGASLPTIYAHGIGASTKPIITISSHTHSDGDTVWYMGGNIAEDGVNSSDNQLIQHTQHTLNKALPWLETQNLEWATHSVNRAEPAQKNLLRPDTAFVESDHNIHIAWPTKLALTPDLSDKVIAKMQATIQSVKVSASTSNNTHKENDTVMSQLPHQCQATVASSLWDRTFDATH